ncbi:O-acetylhomoserine aminocarboxypropyltransferase/cysteine synthase family protein [Nonomuraea coxensis]|uniref:O-acetylhomoserine aminocarboxypropyltransferase/cysteine synthase family protein n=1 Tax=Nonomuraea coxensis TaxID=404386 RepID=UPI001B7FA7DB|nr:PLP-dependent transferase [Nonomuraea coxensis]
MKDSDWNVQTRLLAGGHAAGRAGPEIRPVVSPVYETASFELPGVAEAAALYGEDALGEAFTYSRYANPTCAELERRVSALEEGVGAVATGSGMAAIALSVLNLCQAGDNLVCSSDVYGSTHTLFAHTLRRWGIETRFVDGRDPQAFARAADRSTRALYGETMPNPSLRTFPIRQVADVADRLGVPLIVDNTCAPVLCRPGRHGAAVVVHSATKYIGGHGAALGGVVVDTGRFAWGAAGARLPMLTEPDPAYHGQVWTALAGARGTSAYLVRLRRTLMRDLGPALAASAASRLVQGIQTLPLRMARHCDTAALIASRLHGHPALRRVNHPSLHAGDDARRARHYHGARGGLIGLDVAGGREAAAAFVSRLRIVRHVVNLGDVRTLVTHPAGTTHSQLGAGELASLGISPGYVRLSVGLEDPADLIHDLTQALDAVTLLEQP